VAKNLTINNFTNRKIKKLPAHSLVSKLKEELNFKLISVVINFVTSEEIKRINNEYLNHNYSTDIITFNYSEDNYFLDGEIFISAGEAEENAKKFNVRFEEETARLIIHGFLHLTGYNDLSLEEKKEMKKLEDHLTDKYKNILDT
jgi:probable rRNA maturation factor